jgi:hypothetical protein
VAASSGRAAAPTASSRTARTQRARRGGGARCSAALEACCCRACAVAAVRPPGLPLPRRAPCGARPVESGISDCPAIRAPCFLSIRPAELLHGRRSPLPARAAARYPVPVSALRRPCAPAAPGPLQPSGAHRRTTSRCTCTPRPSALHRCLSTEQHGADTTTALQPAQLSCAAARRLAL